MKCCTDSRSPAAEMASQLAHVLSGDPKHRAGHAWNGERNLCDQFACGRSLAVLRQARDDKEALRRAFAF